MSQKSVQWKPSCFMQTERQTDMKLTVALRNFAKSARKIHLKNETFFKTRRAVLCRDNGKSPNKSKG
jgi:hypothetical protein